MELSLGTYTVADHVVLEVGGEVDVYTAPRMRARIAELVDGGVTGLIIDLHHTDFLDSTGLGVLMGAMRRMRFVGGSLGLVITREALLKIFRITGLDQTFAIYSTVGAALTGTLDTPKVEPPPPIRPAVPVRVRPRQQKPPTKAVVRSAPVNDRPIRPVERPIPPSPKPAASPFPRPPAAARRETKPLTDMARLTQAQRDELVDRYVKGMGIYDVAEMFSVSDRDVWSLLREQGLGPAEWP